MPTKKCAMKMKETNKKKRCDGVYKCFWWNEALYKAHTKNWENNLNKLRVNDSGHNEGSYHLFSKWVNWCQGSGFLSRHVGTPANGAIKLVMADTLRIGGADFSIIILLSY